MAIDPSMKETKEAILAHLASLVGRRLSIARRAADMLVLHFGHVELLKRGSRGEYALHIQCPWRIEGPEGIVTGRTDLWEPRNASERIDRETWDPDANDNLQDAKLAALLGGAKPETRTLENTTDSLTVEGIQADEFGGMTVLLSGGYRLVVFPAGTAGEDWRLLDNIGRKHFVIVGGHVEAEG